MATDITSLFNSKAKKRPTLNLKPEESLVLSTDFNLFYKPEVEPEVAGLKEFTNSLKNFAEDGLTKVALASEYKEKEVVRVEVRARDIYPTATYATTSAALDSYYLPTGSYYSIKDAETEEAVIDFNTAHTKMSTSGSGHYFDLAMNALTAERLYKIVLKVDSRNYNGQVEYFDSNHVFKVVR